MEGWKRGKKGGRREKEFGWIDPSGSVVDNGPGEARSEGVASCRIHFEGQNDRICRQICFGVQENKRNQRRRQDFWPEQLKDGLALYREEEEEDWSRCVAGRESKNQELTQVGDARWTNRETLRGQLGA